MTYPLSQLPADVQAFHAQYAGTEFVTLVKRVPLLNRGDFWRKAIALFRDMDTMLADGWLVIDATK